MGAKMSRNGPEFANNEVADLMKKINDFQSKLHYETNFMEEFPLTQEDYVLMCLKNVLARADPNLSTTLYSNCEKLDEKIKGLCEKIGHGATHYDTWFHHAQKNYVLRYLKQAVESGNQTLIHCALAFGTDHTNCYLGNKCPVTKFSDDQGDLALRAYASRFSAYTANEEDRMSAWDKTWTLFAALYSKDLCWIHYVLNKNSNPNMHHICNLASGCPCL